MAGPGCCTCTSKQQGTMQGWSSELEPLARAFGSASATTFRSSPIRSASAPTSTRHSHSCCLSNGQRSSTRRSPTSSVDRALHWFGADRDCQAWEPGGDEFLSPALVEALCMARTHPAEFCAWFGHFLPGVGQAPAGEPVRPGDRQRPKRREDCASGRAESQPGLVLAQHCSAAERRRAVDRPECC